MPYAVNYSVRGSKMKITQNILLLIVLSLYSCAIPPRSNIDNEKQHALVYKNVPDGNRIRILNFDALLAFNIYRKSVNDDDFVLVTTLHRPKLPLRYNFSQWGVEWIDPVYNSTDILYKIVALDESNNEFLELKQIIALPENGEWKVIGTPDD